MITNKIKTLRSNPQLKIKYRSSTQRFHPPTLANPSLEHLPPANTHELSTHEQSSQKSLSRISSDPKMLTNNSYIKIKNVEPNCIENFLQSMNKYEQNRSRLVSMKSSECLMSNVDLNLNSSSKRAKFTRKSPGFGEEEKAKKCSVVENLQEKELVLKEKQIETLKEELQLTMKSLQSKNKKIKEYERLCTNMKQQYQEKISRTEKRCTELAETLLNKEKEADELQFQVRKFKMENQNLQKKISQIIQEVSFCKEVEPSISLAETGSNLYTLNELQDEIYQKNLQIYELKKNMDKLQIREHYTKASHEEQMRKVRVEGERRQQLMRRRYKQVQVKLKAMQSQNRIITMGGKGIKNPEKDEQKEQQSLDLSLSFDL